MNPHILIVDDEAPLRETLSLYLRKKGFEASTAATSEEARELVEKVPFRLVILDVDLDGDNGLDLLGPFKSKHPGMPILIFTGRNDAKDLEQAALACGADGFLRKTDSLDELLAAVRKHVASVSG